MTLFICGLPRAGKTTLGKKIAKKMDYLFIDSDQEIEKQENISVKDFCKNYGEAAFREKEYLFLKKINLLQQQIIALGGGILTYDPSFHFLMEQKVLFLNPPLEVILERLKKNPLLFLDNQTFYSFAEKRVERYFQVADFVFSPNSSIIKTHGRK
jgi:shikimate kinase